VTVFAVHEIKYDVAPARKFGDIQYVNKFYIHGDELENVDGDNYVPRGWQANLERCVGRFNPDEDYLLIIGDDLQLLALTGMLLQRHAFVRVLRWDRQLREYIPIRLGSGIASTRQPVLSSGAHIGDSHGKDRYQNYCEYCEKTHDPRVACPEYLARRRLEASRPARDPAKDDS